MARIQDIDIPYLEFGEAAAPGTPAAAVSRIYAKADGLMYSKDDAGAETLMSSGGAGSVATDAIWDAAGDLAVGSGANTAVKLVKGAAGGTLAMGNSAVIWNAGTSFPGSKATGDRYFRTDLGLEAYWNGTQWVTTNLYHMVIPNINTAGDVFSATNNAGFRAPVWNAVYDLLLVDFYGMTFVSTTNSGSAFWTVTLYKETKAAAYSQTSVVSFSTGTGPDTASQFIVHTVAINALLGTASGTMSVGLAKTSTPGNITASFAMTYRVVLT